MNRTCAVLLLWFAVSSAYGANAPSSACPNLSDANQRLQLRAAYLLEETSKKKLGSTTVLQETFFTTEATSPAPNLYVALASVIAARAKEEARLWLLDKLNEQICADNSANTKYYFPNTCRLMPEEGVYPGPSLNSLRTGLRQDLYALPACFMHLPAADPGNAASDEKIDPYLIEALLVAAYRLSREKSDSYDDAPGLDPLPTKSDVVRLLALTALARQKPWDWVPGAAFAPLSNEPKQCFDRTQACLRGFVNELTSILDAEGFASPERLVRKLIEYLKHYDVDRATVLEQYANGYFSAVRGDYAEAALGFAAPLFCGKVNAPELCTRLPLLAEVAAAKTQDDMEAALDRLISPIGAWKRKQSECVVSLNAMAGFAVGTEELKDQGASVRHTTVGLYMPIGLEVSKPIDTRWFRAIAVGATMLDLGGIVSYSQEDELQGGETSTAANADWSSLAAPGVYVALAIKESPFRVGLSWSKTPALRSIDFGDGVEKDVDSTRLMFFVTVDVTLLSF